MRCLSKENTESYWSIEIKRVLYKEGDICYTKIPSHCIKSIHLIKVESFCKNLSQVEEIIDTNINFK